ncbi:hypothetical protein [Halomonas aquatica]|uniref:Uncharacterized protein n=1 Tax=Halomonas aquatica TaxID=3151123 RepID=A0ABV1NC25_9GAMM
MSQKERRLGVSESNLVTRTLKLQSGDADALRLAIADIDVLFGLQRANYDTGKGKLKMA